MTTTALPLAGRAALVTGGGSGIGLAVARALLAGGATVTVMGRSAPRLEGAAADLRTHAPEGAEVLVHAGDVADEDAVAAAVSTASSPLGGLHIAVANAGMGSFGPIVTTDRGAWDQVLATNLTGAFFVVKHAGAAIARSGGGSIVAVSSIAGSHTHRWMSAYCVSKAGLEMLVRCAADELGASGVRVNAVRPGLVRTDLSSGLTGSDDIRADYLDQMPVSRVGEPDDVAALVRFLAGPESSWITGTCVAVDGGHHLRRGPDLTAAVRMVFGDDAVVIG